MRKKVILGLVFILLFSLFTVMSSEKAVAGEDSLSTYYAILAELNEELGTDYMFLTTEQLADNGESYSDLVEFYSAMSPEQFRVYIIEAHENETKGSDIFTAGDILDIGNKVEPLAASKTQRFYYDATVSNCIYIVSTVYNAEGQTRYSSIDSYGCEYTSYPYYKPSSMTRTYSSGTTKVTCTFVCAKYIGYNIISATSYTLKVTFVASGGDVYIAI